MEIGSFASLVLAIALAPLLVGVIHRTKAVFAGRVGQPLFQLYYDLWKLIHKGAVYSKTTTWVFRSGPIITLSAILLALTVIPFGSWGGALRFPGDLLLLVYLLGLARVFTVLAALDTGSSFEGMGASREVLFSALAEPALLLGLAALARKTSSLSLSEMHLGLAALWAHSALVIALVIAALMVVLLAENSRIPVDDPNTHLELTMIHEVMVLDHGGPDFAFIQSGAALKLWIFCSLLVGLMVPRTGYALVDAIFSLAGVFALAVVVGVVESTMARLRLVRVPQLLIGAAALSALALVLVYGEAVR